MIGYKVLDDTIKWWLIEDPSITNTGEIKNQGSGKVVFL